MRTKMIPDDALACVMMFLCLPRLANLKLVGKEWRRVARRVLTSKEWLLQGGNNVEVDEFAYFFTPDWHSEIPKSMPNLFSMCRTIDHQWTSLHLPCSVVVNPRLDDCEEESLVGVLEDLTVDKDMIIRSMVLEFSGRRFFSPDDLFYNFCKERPDKRDITWVLDVMTPVIQSRHYLWCTGLAMMATLNHGIPITRTMFDWIKDGRFVYRASGASVRV